MKAISFFSGVKLALMGGSLTFGMVLASSAAASATASTPGASVPAIPAVAANNPEADKAWKETYKAVQDPMPPADWQKDPPSPDEVKKFYLSRLVTGADKAKDFYTRYPDHAKAETARRYEYKLVRLAVQQFGDKTQTDRLAMLTMERLKDPKLTDAERSELAKDPNLPESAQAALLQSGSLSADDKFALRLQPLVAMTSKLPDNLDDYLNKVEALRADYPKEIDVYRLLMTAVQAGAGDKTEALLKEVQDAPIPAEFKEAAAKEAHKMDAIGKPVDIQFTAFDGREVDVSKMKGKVVMIDFWATWCGPCIGEAPNVDAAYEKYHDQGFEIVGISLDSEKDALAKYLKKEKVPWPQFFDGNQWKNKFAVQFGINSIPAMWLIDKQGNLRYIDARGKLDTLIPKLLKEDANSAPPVKSNASAASPNPL